MRIFFFILLSGILSFSCELEAEDDASIKYNKVVAATPPERIAGVNLEMPSREIDSTQMFEVQSTGAGWVSMIPYGVTMSGGVEVKYDRANQWWGESEQGTKECIKMARAAGFKIMIKPHVWSVDHGWQGRFDAGTEERWKLWEQSYRAYILKFAKIAEEENAELFCIGTEYRIAVVKRPEFWRKLIREVREIYHGKLTYAANWDNYERVTFWNELDFIGIDAYFPLSKEKQPTLKKLVSSWKKRESSFEKFAEKEGKKILFTEYGTRSMDYSTTGKWGDYDKVNPNMINQKRYYQAFFETIWQEEWMAGGFFWKWQFQDTDGERIGGEKDDDYTPQNKPALEIIKKWYERSSPGID